MPEELLQQIPILKEVLEKAGVSLQYQEGYEADDVLGTMGKWYGEQGHAVTILSGDRDLLQLVDAHIKLLIPKTKKGGNRYTYRKPTYWKNTGVSPAGYLQMKALMGDPSDNIPGVPAHWRKKQRLKLFRRTNRRKRDCALQRN